jgi:uncharacterized membrane protein
MNLVLWLVAGLLTAVFGATGILKLTQSRDHLARSGITWVEDFSTPAIRTIGALELLAALALVLPAAFGTATWLTPLAAVGLTLLMAGAVIVHLRRHEPGLAVGTGLLLLLAALVAWGRLGPYPL